METKYWFVLRQSVFIWKKADDCYFYDSERFIGKQILLENIETKHFIENITEIDNLYSLSIETAELKVESLDRLVKTLVQLNMGKLIEQRYADRKPIQLPPLLNLQSDIYRLKDDKLTNATIGENILKNLQFINLQLNNNALPSFYSQLSSFFSSCLGRNSLFEITIKGYSHDLEIDDLFWKQLDKISYAKRFIFELKENAFININKLRSLPLTNFLIEFTIYPDCDIYLMEYVKKLSDLNIHFKYIFPVFSKDDYLAAEKIVKELNLISSLIQPQYNGKNIDFFKEYVYIDEQDILDSHQTKQNIFAHQVINTNDFGKLTITSDSNVYANVHHAPLGTINDDIRYLVYEEMYKGISWRRIRNMEPCSDCVFQWLCPSPSDYELDIGKPNLCHFK